MKLRNLRYPLVKLPAKTDLVLHLIREELKITKFFNGLANIGIHDCYYEPQLNAAILACMGFDKIEDDLLEYYLNLADKYSGKIEADGDSITKQAMRFYLDLLQEKHKRG